MLFEISIEGTHCKATLFRNYNDFLRRLSKHFTSLLHTYTR